MLLVFALLFLLVRPCLPTSTACYNKGSETIKIGTKSSLCLIILPLNWNTSGEVVQLVGSFTVDVLSSFSVPGSWSSVVYKNDTLMQKLSISNEEQQGTGVGVVVATSGILSYQRAYRLTRAPLQTPAPTSRPTTPMPQANLTSSSTIELKAKMSGKDVASKPTQESSVQEEPLSSTSTSSSSTTTSLNGITFPLMMVIVNVNKGAVQSVVWDDTCSWCGKSQCTGNTLSLTYPQKAVSEGSNCFVNDDTCSVGSSSTQQQHQTNAPTPSPLTPSHSPSSSSPTNGGNSTIPSASTVTPSTSTTAPTAISTSTPSISPTVANKEVTSTKLCELKVYIAWTGTDANGASLQSSAKRFSRLSNVQLTSFTSSQQNTVSAV